MTRVGRRRPSSTSPRRTTVRCSGEGAISVETLRETVPNLLDLADDGDRGRRRWFPGRLQGISQLREAECASISWFSASRRLSPICLSGVCRRAGPAHGSARQSAGSGCAHDRNALLRWRGDAGWRCRRDLDLLAAALPRPARDRCSKTPGRCLVAAVVICLVGVLDDVFELPPLTKFAGQVFAAGIAVALGVKMLWIPLPNKIVSLDGTTSVAITVFFIVLCSNAVNFVDGLDGLATGVVGIGALAFFAYSYLLTVTEGLTRATTSSLVTVAIAGACLGFLPHNFFPARMFMGTPVRCCWVCCWPHPPSA